MNASILVYAGLIVLVAGGASVLWPLLFLRIRTRKQGALVFAAGFVALAVAFLWPASETRVAPARTRLDEFAPKYQFHEFHRIEIKAPRERVYRAIKEVTPTEITLFRTLTWIRRGGASGPESILNAPEREPIFALALRTSFLLLAEEPGREVVLGTLVAAPRRARLNPNPMPQEFKALNRPGFAKASINFWLEDSGPGTSLLTSETRVYATDASTRRLFTPYWRIIYPGSALIRRMWLQAIKNRAEARGA